MTLKDLMFFSLATAFLLLISNSYLAAQNLDKDEDFERRWAKNETKQYNWGLHFDSNWDNDSWNDFRVGLLDVGFSTYLYKNSLNLPAELDDFDLDYGGSLNFNLHIVRHRLPIVKDNLRLEYGLTISWMQYKFSNDFRILEDTIPFTIEDDGTNYQKNKLKTTFLEVPLMLTLAPGKNKSFYVSAGVYGGILIGAKQKLKTQSGEKIKNKDDFNLNKFRYGVTGRVGFGPVALYAELALNELFKENQGPKLVPFNIGLTLLNY